MTTRRKQHPGTLIPYLFVCFDHDRVRSIALAGDIMDDAECYDFYLGEIVRSAGTSDLSKIDISGWRERAKGYGQAWA
jgi:hypothetical protein